MHNAAYLVPVATYCSTGDLQIEGIIPRTPDPTYVEEDDSLDELPWKELVRLLQDQVRLTAGADIKQEETKIEREEHSADDPHDDQDDGITVLEES